MQQAGRYMANFWSYFMNQPSPMHSKTPSMATELLLQYNRVYSMDGIIVFLEILTLLPTLGIDFDMVRSTGPVISKDVRTKVNVVALRKAANVDFNQEMPFVREILTTL